MKLTGNEHFEVYTMLYAFHKQNHGKHGYSFIQLQDYDACKSIIRTITIFHGIVTRFNKKQTKNQEKQMGIPN